MSLEVSLPRGGLRLNDASMNVFIAGGIGVTLFVSAIGALERAGRANYELHWASAGAPRRGSNAWAAKISGRVHQYNTFTGPDPISRTSLASARRDARVYCCGPAGMLDEFERLTAGWASDQVHIERFVPPAGHTLARSEALQPHPRAQREGNRRC